jgi:broad specificity phosphatase PhoE
VLACYRSLVREHAGEAIIIVPHGAALAALQAGIHEWDLLDTWRTRRARMGNTAVTVVEVENGVTRSLVTNSSEHLPKPTGMKSLMDPSAPLV